MKPKYYVALFAIIVIAVLEIFALYRGIDGTALSAAVGGIGAITGYLLKSK